MTFRFGLLASAFVLLSSATIACGDGDTDPDGGGNGSQGGDGPGGESAGLDLDGDGHVSVVDGGDDCDDSSAAAFPGAPDTVGDGIDQSCDGIDGVDADDDGYASTESLGTDCNDASPAVHPGASDSAGQLGQTVVFTAERPSQDPYITVTSDGFVHIGFTETYHVGNVVHHRPKVTSNASGIWVDQSFGEDGFAIGIVSNEETVHFSYGRSGNGDGVVYAAGPSTALALDASEVTSQGSVRGLSLDGSGTPFLALHDGSYPEGALSLATGTESGFAVTPVSPLAGSTPVALAVDPAGEPALVFHTAAGLNLARRTGNSWTTETFATGDIGDRAALAFDVTGGAHVLYESEGMLRYFGPDATTETIPLDVDASYAKLQLAAAPDGTLHMSVSQHSYGAHVFYGALGPNGWVVHKIIESTDTVGEDASLAVTGDGTVHFAYTGNYSVYYASMAAANGVDDDCDGEAW
ncbi:MAG: hypothetical protein JNK04_12810 [Myxococcales bacterium]|nr:hypothetical protein [Myxococcales bacterium]